MDFSREFGLTANIIEKDYVLGWLLAGISNHSELESSFVFKGGTCLKKCYFETYRFSEDLDFTIINDNQIDQEFLINAFREVAGWVYDATGIEIPLDTIRFDIHENPHGRKSVQGRISYRGPLQRRGDPDRIKLDLSSDEMVILETAVREVHHPYSDKPENGVNVKCYCFEELFAEKVRALGDRLRPRDLYDVIHLYRHEGLRPDRDLVVSTLRKKCDFKSIETPTMKFIENKPERSELKSEWETMLAHQLPELPPFDHFWNELSEVFDWLYGIIEKVVPQSIPLMGREVDETWHAPEMAQPWHTSVPLEPIRFAAANRLCVDLTYQGSNRLIEPYSLRRTSDGNLLLYAVKHNTGEDRSYRIDRIQGAKVTKISFSPRYSVELTTSGSFTAPPISRSLAGIAISRSFRNRSTPKRSKRKTSNYGPKYVFKCTICGKQFTRKSYNASLNQHKNKQGYPCYGRTGIYVTTKY